jgi:arabinofuranosyltransferase
VIAHASRTGDRPPLVPRIQIQVVVVAAVALYFTLWWQVRGFVADDTYIHLTYAKHVRDGQGLVFNVGERVYGTTSPLWSLGLGFLGRTGLDLMIICRTLSVAFGLATVLLGAAALHQLLSTWKERYDLDARVAPLAWSLGTLALAADVWLVRWSASGMESSLGAFLVLCGFVAYIRSHPWGSAALAPGCWWALASLIRPEASLLLGLLAIRSALEPGGLLARLRRVGAALLPFALVGGAWLAHAASFYGTVVPITFASKAAEKTPFFENLIVQAQELGADRGAEIVALMVVLPMLASRLRPVWREHLVPLGWLVALPLFYAVSQLLGITRYLLVLVPILVCYGWGAIAYAASRGMRRGAATLSLAAVLGIGLAALAGNGFVFARHVVPQARAFERILDQSLIPMARWFAAHTPPGTQIAIEHVGAFGYYADRKVVDLAGLVTAEITPILARYPYERMVTEFRFAARVRPDFLIDVDTDSRRMLTQSPYASCLILLEERPFDYKSIRSPGRAFITAYRIDWACFDALPPLP